MRTRRHRTFTLLLAFLTAVGLVLVNGPVASGQTAWADADSATVHPGVQMITDGGQCTANFVFSDGAEVYLGYAAHCAGLGSASDTDGCATPSLPLGTEVEIQGATRPGALAYSSWRAMRNAGETDPDACAFNDFALVRVHPDDVDLVNPSVPHWGGPTGLNTDGNAFGSSVYSYGNSMLRLGLSLLSPKEGVSLGTIGGGWAHPVYTVTPGIPGDSGSAMLDAQGRASGVLSTVAFAPLAGSNNFSDLSRALDYMRAAEPRLAGVGLVKGSAFNGAALPLGL